MIYQEQTRSSLVLEEEISIQDEDRGDLAGSHRLTVARTWVSWQGLAGILTLIGLAAGVYLLTNRTAAGPEMKSIAVLPFKPIVADIRDESLEMGMAEALITRLSNIKHLIVRPISAVRKYSGLEQDALKAGQEQKVDIVLDESIQKAGDKIRVTVRLVSMGDGRQLWVDQLDEKLTDILAVQDSISRQVVSALEMKLTGKERELITKRYTK